MLRTLIQKTAFSVRMNSTKCNVAVCQFNATNNKTKNLEIVQKLVKEAVEKNARVVFLPEACDFIGRSKEETKKLAETLNGTLMQEYKSLAEKYQIWLSVGGFHELCPENGALSNAHVLIDDKGNIKTVYRKIHLFDVCIPEQNIKLLESRDIKPGKYIVPPIQTPAGMLAPSICYDLRFPEQSILQRKMGAEILCFPSAFTSKTGLAHWEILLRSRAIENQCYVIAAAQYGKHNEKRTSYGQSMIVDPWGTILAQCPKYQEGVETNESVAIATIDKCLLNKIRSEMPVFEHRRGDIYDLKTLEENIYSINDDEIFYFADKKVPGTTVFLKTKFSFAFTNIRCVVPGHVLISSLRKAERLENLSQEEIADLFQTAVKVEKVMESIYGTKSSTICVQDGPNAGQTVPSVHVHILPRKAGDFERNDDVYSELAKHDREDNLEPIRDICEMIDEAKKLRKHFY